MTPSQFRSVIVLAHCKKETRAGFALAFVLGKMATLSMGAAATSDHKPLTLLLEWRLVSGPELEVCVK